MKKIPLTQGLFALVDDADFEAVSKFKWHAKRDRKQFYATRKIPKKSGGQKTVWLHGFLMPGIRVDHIDGDGLNNQRANFRDATLSQNSCNRGPNKNNTSGFKGVNWAKKVNKWHAKIMLTGRRYHLGYFNSAAEAARAYDAAALKLHGDFAYLNFPATPIQPKS